MKSRDDEKLKMILAENLKNHLRSKGVTQTMMANALDIPETTVSNWVKGKTYPRPDKIQLMADYFGVRRSDLTEEKNPNIIPLEPRTVRVPILGRISCGDPIRAEENIGGYIMKAPEDVKGGNYVAVEAEGDSMFPTIPDGAIVIIREQPTAENGQIVAALVNGYDEVFLKRYQREGDVVLLSPDNPKHKTFVITENNPAKIIGVATSYEMRI